MAYRTICFKNVLKTNFSRTRVFRLMCTKGYVQRDLLNTSYAALQRRDRYQASFEIGYVVTGHRVAVIRASPSSLWLYEILLARRPSIARGALFGWANALSEFSLRMFSSRARTKRADVTQE